jgi:hypothetical protein
MAGYQTVQYRHKLIFGYVWMKDDLKNFQVGHSDLHALHKVRHRIFVQLDFELVDASAQPIQHDALEGSHQLIRGSENGVRFVGIALASQSQMFVQVAVVIVVRGIRTVGLREDSLEQWAWVGWVARGERVNRWNCSRSICHTFQALPHKFFLFHVHNASDIRSRVPGSLFTLYLACFRVVHFVQLGPVMRAHTFRDLRPEIIISEHFVEYRPPSI